jgi:hypothetical protein
MKGFYSYCIIKKLVPEEEPTDDETIYNEGIDPRFPVTIVKYKDIGTAVSEVILTEYEENFHESLQNNDLQWIEEKARRHTYLQEIISKDYTTLPLRFYTIYNNKRKIINNMAENYDRCCDLLEKVKFKSEWTLKLFLNRDIFEEKAKHLQEKKLELELLNKPPGVAYLLKKKYHEALQREIQDKLAQKINELHKDILNHFATELIIEENLSKEITGCDEEMVLKCSILIPNNQAADFVRQTEEINAMQSTSGLLIELSGPWPPYSFTNVDLAT